MNRLSNYPWLLLIILGGFGLRIYRLGESSLWYDETVSAYLARQSIVELVSHTARDIHPPGYYLLLHLWTTITGEREFALAYLSLIFGLWLIPLVYRLADDLTNRRVAIWAALLMASSPLGVWYAQEVRMYTLGASLGLLMGWCGIRGAGWVVHSARRPYWLGYAVCAALGLYTLYYFAFLWLVVNLFLIIWGVRSSRFSGTERLKPRRRAYHFPWPAFMLANGLTIVAYTPWLPIVWRQATNPPVPPWRTLEGWSISTISLEIWTALSLGQSVEPATVWPVLILTGWLFLCGSYALGRRSMWVLAFLLTYLLAPILLINLLSLITPLYHVRYIFIYSPTNYIILAAGLVALANRLANPVGWLSHIVALIISLPLMGAVGYALQQYHTNPDYQADDFRAAVDFIHDQWQPDDIIMVNAGYIYPALDYYAEFPAVTRRRLVPYPATVEGQPVVLQTGTINGSPQLGWGDPAADFYAMSPTETRVALEQLAAEFPRLWVLRAYDTVTDPTAYIRQWLNQHTQPIVDQLFTGPSNIRVQGFLLHSEPPGQHEPVHFADGLTLLDWQLPAQRWSPNETVHLKLWWTITAQPTVDYKTSLKLWRPTGELATQGQDSWPVGPLYRATDWQLGQPVYQPASLTLPADLAPGQYWLNVELYHPTTLMPLPRLDGADPVVTLGPVEVGF